MAYQFLYRTNQMYTNAMIDYLLDLFNKDVDENQKISKCNIVDLVENYLPSTAEPNYSGLFDELQERIEIEYSEEYISQEKNIDDAVDDFFDTSRHNFALDLWDVDPEVRNEETGEMIDISHYKQWNF